MKQILFFMVLVAASKSLAWDSVAVFHRPEKVVVQINERGVRGHADSRLQSFIDIFILELMKDGGQLILESVDKNMRLNCNRNAEAVSCVIRFLPAAHTDIGDKDVKAVFKAVDFGLQQFGSDSAVYYSSSFLNSNGDRFEIILTGSQLSLTGSKK